MTRVAVNPEILQWAGQRAGLPLDDLRRKFPKVSDWFQGELAPTLKQLESFARATHTPVGFFFLPEPPEISLPIPDFRTIGAEGLGSPSPDLLETIYLCQQRQDWYRDYALLYGEERLSWVGSGSIETEVVEAAAELRELIGLELIERQKLSTWSDALRLFIDQVETAGALVMISGIVGSNTHRKLSPEEFRGFALVDLHAPVIFINGADSKSAQMFTLAHELVHLWLGETGVSDSQVVHWPEKGGGILVQCGCGRIAGSA